MIAINKSQAQPGVVKGMTFRIIDTVHTFDVLQVSVNVTQVVFH